MGKSPSIWQGMEKDQSYTWYKSKYTKYTLVWHHIISYTSVYAIIYQVYGRIQEYMTGYKRFMVEYKSIWQDMPGLRWYISVHGFTHCDSRHRSAWILFFPREHPSYTVNSHHNTAKLPSYTLSSLYIPDMPTLILSIYQCIPSYDGMWKYIPSYDGIC